MSATTGDPGAVWRIIHGYTAYWAAVAGVRLGLFDALADGPLDPAGLAGRCAAGAGGPDGVAVIADALTAVGLLERDAGVYRLSGPADAHLVGGRPGSMADLLIWSPGPPANWPALDRTVRGSGPPCPVDDDFYAQLVDATFPAQVAVAGAVLDGLAPAPGARLLELGAGRGPWTVALLGADPGASAVLNDLPRVLAATGASLGPLAGRCAFVPGDYLSSALPAGPFDLVVLGHVLRAEPDDRAARLVARAAGCLAGRGRLVVTEYLGGRDPVAHPQPALLAVTMLAATAQGRVRTAGQIEAWIEAAGCAVVARPDPIANTDIIVAAPTARSQGAP